MRVLVTGACGFIGRHVCGLALARGFEVYGLDLADQPPPELEPGRYARGEGVALLPGLLERFRPQVCIHAAGAASVGESLRDPASDFASGPALTFALLDAIRSAAPDCRTLFLSSAAVYGLSLIHI